jgi:hypothetical protein
VETAVLWERRSDESATGEQRTSSAEQRAAGRNSGPSEVQKLMFIIERPELKSVKAVTKG